MSKEFIHFFGPLCVYIFSSHKREFSAVCLDKVALKKHIRFRQLKNIIELRNCI